ncbi:MAG: aspartate aminotransferase family protein [Gammaproteobacteria bacterium]|nr:aspartate aminotransferase family protein [Gammaproteobacteria bacterium]
MSTLNWPFSQDAALNIVKAEGAHLFTETGQAVLDAAGGAVVTNVGHGRQRVVEALAKATAETTYVVPPWITPGRQAMVEALERDWLPEGISRMHITSGGSEAVESAVKLVFMHHAAQGDLGRRKILSRDISYHGATFTTTAISGHWARRQGLEQALPDHPKAPTAHPLRCPLGAHHPQAGDHYVEAMVEVIEREGPDSIAALIVEPITGASGGAIVPPEDYWPKVRDLCDEHGILLVFDEVMTGFGRTGLPFGHQHWPVTPDLLVGGKGMAGGYAPLGGVFTTEAIGASIDAAGYSLMFHTFGAHPGACAAAAEVLAIMVEEDLVKRARQLGERLATRLQEAFSNHPHVAESRGRGLLQGIEIVADRSTLAPFPKADQVAARVVKAALDRGVFFYAGGTGEFRDVILLGPPFIVTEGDIDTMAAVLREAVDEVAGC